MQDKPFLTLTTLKHLSLHLWLKEVKAIVIDVCEILGKKQNWGKHVCSLIPVRGPICSLPISIQMVVFISLLWLFAQLQTTFPPQTHTLLGFSRWWDLNIAGMKNRRCLNVIIFVCGPFRRTKLAMILPPCPQKPLWIYYHVVDGDTKLERRILLVTKKSSIPKEAATCFHLF